MANYVAELISNAESAKPFTERARLRAECAREILAIWHHRASIPHGVNPLRDVSEVLKAIVTIAKPDPWRQDTFGNEWLNRALAVNRSSQFLIQVLLRAAINKAAVAKAKRFASDFAKLLSPTERRVIEGLGGIVDAQFVFGAQVDIALGANHSVSIRSLTPEEAIDRRLKATEAEIEQILVTVRTLRECNEDDRRQLFSEESGKKKSSSPRVSGPRRTSKSD